MAGIIAFVYFGSEESKVLCMVMMCCWCGLKTVSQKRQVCVGLLKDKVHFDELNELYLYSSSDSREFYRVL